MQPDRTDPAVSGSAAAALRPHAAAKLHAAQPPGQLPVQHGRFGPPRDHGQQQQQRQGLRRRQQQQQQQQQQPSLPAQRRVTFLPGPLPTGDGHPLTEGTLAKKPALDGGHMVCEGTPQPTRLTKKEVLGLEALLSEQRPDQYTASIAKLKMRVGLLPQQSPPRPYAAAKAATAGDGQQGCGAPSMHAGPRKRSRD